MTPSFYDDDFEDDYEDVDDPQGILRADREAEIEASRQTRIAAGIEDACRVCGCSETRGCEAGCVWAEADLCSRCYRASAAMAKAFSAGGEDV